MRQRSPWKGWGHGRVRDFVSPEAARDTRAILSLPSHKVNKFAKYLQIIVFFLKKTIEIYEFNDYFGTVTNMEIFAENLSSLITQAFKNVSIILALENSKKILLMKVSLICSFFEKDVTCAPFLASFRKFHEQTSGVF